VVVAKRAEQLKDREPGLVADDDLAVEQAGACRQRRDRRHDQEEAFGKIVAVADDQAPSASRSATP
jgi:hypothetical protein